MATKALNVVLVSPRIPGNVGSIGRTCVGFNAHLHICGPLGFRMDDKALARARIDYWDMLDPHWTVYHDWDAFENIVSQGQLLKRAWFFSARAKRALDHVGLLEQGPSSVTSPLFLVFGSEKFGLASLLGEERMRLYADKMILIPMDHPEMRCHNLATSVGIALWETRQQITREAQRLV